MPEALRPSPHYHVARYTVRRFGLPSFLKFGFVLGAAVSLGPSLMVTLVVMGLIAALRRFLEGLRDVGGQTIPFVNYRITFDFVELFHLSDVLQTLALVDSRAGFYGAILFVLLAMVAALSLGLASIILAIVYNVLAKTTGGLVVELAEMIPGPSKERSRGNS